ncbi:restriction endonuclease subunit S [Clostridium perfringens]|nr:restriction endonuclease subunit S [Clostridium perfringens]
MSFRNNDWHNYILNDFIKYSSEKIDIEKISEFNYISTENMLPNKGQIINASSLPKSKTVTKYSIGDTLISNIRPYFKKIWFANKIGGASNDVLVIKSDNALVDKKFLYYLLSEDSFFDYVMLTSKGTKMPRGDKGAILNYKASLPPLKEQKAIAKILSDLDEKIEVNNKINKNLEEMAQVIFKQWFVDFEFPNEEGKPYKSSGGEMVESELGMIPKGWKCCSLSEIVEISTKSEKPFENKNIVYEHFSLPACDNGKRAVKELGSLISSNKYKIDNNSILISKMNPMTKRIWNPLCKSSNAICSTEFIVYKPKLDFAKSFCYEVINSKKFTDFLVSNATGSTGSRQRVKPKETLNYRLVLPKANVITNVAEKLESIHLKIKLNIEENERLEKLRDTLLPKLMSGEIRVPLEYSEN